MSMSFSNLEVPVFYPTHDEFNNFSNYISKIESYGAHKIGLAKIVPPKQWVARKTGYKEKQIDDTIVENPIKQEVHGKDGIYLVYNIQQKSVKLNQFRKLSSTTRYMTPPAIANNFEKLEKKYWENLTSISPIYGADVSGSFYDITQNVWNVNRLGTILDDLETDYGTKIEGVNTTYLYFGMWKATFAWHTEDMDLYSINYLHFGAPKQWYVIPPSYGKHFEKFASTKFPSLARRCPAFLRHKMSIISPSILEKQSIPFSKITQYENEFIITFPYAYHAGFNYGFNCAESTNFASERWIEYGKHSVQCSCRHDMVKIGMDRFVSKYQPHLYDGWCHGINLTSHPEDEQITINTPTIIRTSPTKRRLPQNNYSKISIDSISNKNLTKISHQEEISNERYACIFRNLAEFDKQNYLCTKQYSTSLIRAALCRAKFKLNKYPEENRTKLLCITAAKTFDLSSIPELIVFYGLNQSKIYHENILNGLWNYQLLNSKSRNIFNQWLSDRISVCSICYIFNHNKCDKQSQISICQLIMPNFKIHLNNSTRLLQCVDCNVIVHQKCYEYLCLALNIAIIDQYEKWHCPQCTLKNQSCSNLFDDRCSACLLRGGLLLKSNSSSFVHAVCSIYEAHQPSSSSSTVIKSCHYCWPFCPLDYRQISTHIFASCHHSNCNNIFHVTCGLINECTFEVDHEHSIINARCHLHSKYHQSSKNINNQQTSINNQDYETTECFDNRTDNEQQHEDDEHDDDEMDEEENEDDRIVEENHRVPVGTRVILNEKNENKVGRVVGNEITFQYAVDFGDGSYSNDMLAEDILDCDPSIEPIMLTVGSNIRIKWTDGTIYSCKYLGRKRVLLYHIKIDNETRQIRRSEFSYDTGLLSPSLTSCSTEREHNYSRRQPITTGRKRRSQRKQSKQSKRKRRHLNLSTSSDE